MIRISTIFIGFVLLLPSCTTTKFSLWDTQSNPISNKVTNILIVGIGSTTSRIFLESLGLTLTKKLKSTGIKSEYQYLGSDNEIAKENFNALKKNGFEAILIFTPENTSFFEVSTNRELNSLNTGQGSLPYYSNSTSITYAQNFFLRLYLLENKNKPIWDAKLTLDFNLTKSSVYKSISDKILERLKDNNYIQ